MLFRNMVFSPNRRKQKNAISEKHLSFVEEPKRSLMLRRSEAARTQLSPLPVWCLLFKGLLLTSFDSWIYPPIRVRYVSFFTFLMEKKPSNNHFGLWKYSKVWWRQEQSHKGHQTGRGGNRVRATSNRLAQKRPRLLLNPAQRSKNV